MSKKAQGKFKVLFVAGFGPIVQDIPKSHKFYVDALGLSFQKEAGDYLHTEKLDGVKTFALWPLSQAAQSCFGSESLKTPAAAFKVTVEWMTQNNTKIQLTKETTETVHQAGGQK